MLRRFTHSVAGGLVVALASCSRGAPPSSSREAGAPAVVSAAAIDGAAPARAVDFDASVGELPADAPFEGRITASAGDPSPDADVRRKRQAYSFTVQGKRFRWDIFVTAEGRASQGYRIYDGEKKKFFTVLEPTRQVMIFDEPSAAVDAGVSPTWKFVPVTKGNIAGHPCDIESTSDTTREYEACIAHDLPTFPFHLLVGVASEAAPFNVALEAQGEFPLVASAYPKRPKGALKGDPRAPHSPRGLLARFEVWEITRFRVNPAVFDIPSDYTQIQSTHLDIARPSLR
jgi:hypothetical protein